MNADNISFQKLESKTSIESEVIEGMTHVPRRLPSRLLYDERGSLLFEMICETPEYYLTRSEMQILDQYVPELSALIEDSSLIIEFGAGNLKKAEKLLSEVARPVTYVPVDISEQHLKMNAIRLAEALPDVRIEAIVGDFHDIKKRKLNFNDIRRTVLFMPGSSIGNLSPKEAIELLRSATDLIGENGAILVGVDLKKDRAIIESAYNDAFGITAKFEKNILLHINRELKTEINPDDFEYEGFYNEHVGRVEMYLKSKRSQIICVGEERFILVPNERIHIENSYKYTIDEFVTLAALAGYQTKFTFTDPEGLFSLHFLEVRKN